MGKIKKEQLAVGSYHYSCNSLDYFLQSMKNLGVKNIEIQGNRNHFIVEDETEETAKRLGEKIKEMGLNIVCFCPEQNTFPFNICHPSQVSREHGAAYLKKAIKLCRAMGCSQMLLCPGTGFLEEDAKEVWDRCKKSIQELLPVAEEEKVTLLLETQGLEESAHINSVEQQAKMLEEINHPYLKAMLDTVQMAMFDKGIAHDIEVLGENLRHVHLGNTKLVPQEWEDKELYKKLTKGMQSYGHTGIMDGELPLEEYLEELGKSGYSRYVTMEICSADYFLEAERHAKEGYERLCAVVEE